MVHVAVNKYDFEKINILEYAFGEGGGGHQKAYAVYAFINVDNCERPLSNICIPQIKQYRSISVCNCTLMSSNTLETVSCLLYFSCKKTSPNPSAMKQGKQLIITLLAHPQEAVRCHAYTAALDIVKVCQVMFYS